MAKTEMIRARVEPELKRGAGTLLDRLGCTQSHSRAGASGRRLGVVADADRSDAESYGRTVGREMCPNMF